MVFSRPDYDRRTSLPRTSAGPGLRFGDDVWLYVQAGIEYGDMGDHGAALTWLTAGIDLALLTDDPESALEQLVPLCAAALSAAGQTPDDIQVRAGHALAHQATPGPTTGGTR